MKAKLAALLTPMLIGCSVTQSPPDGPIIDPVDRYSYIHDQDISDLVRTMDAIQAPARDTNTLWIRSSVYLYERSRFQVAPTPQLRENYAQENFLFVVAQPSLLEYSLVPLLPILVNRTEAALDKDADILYAPSLMEFIGAVGSDMYQDVVFLGHGSWGSYSPGTGNSITNEILQSLADYGIRKTGLCINYHCSSDMYLPTPNPEGLQVFLNQIDDHGFFARAETTDLGTFVYLQDITARIPSTIEHLLKTHYGVNSLNEIEVPPMPNNTHVTNMYAHTSPVAPTLQTLFEQVPLEHRYDVAQEVFDQLLEIPEIDLFNQLAQPYIESLNLEYNLDLLRIYTNSQMRVVLQHGDNQRYSHFFRIKEEFREQKRQAGLAYVRQEPFGSPIFEQVHSYDARLTSPITYFLDPLPPRVE